MSSEDGLMRLLMNAVGNHNCPETAELQNEAIKAFRAKDRDALIAVLKKHKAYTPYLKEFIQISLTEPDSGSETVRERKDDGVNALLYDALVDWFAPANPKEILKRTRVLANSDINYQEAIDTARKIHKYHLDLGNLSLPFIIPESPEPVEGAVCARLSPCPKDVRLVEFCNVISSKKSGAPFIKFLGDNMERRGRREIVTEAYYTSPFWMYKFARAGTNQTFILLSKDEIEPGYCTLRGCPIRVRDASDVGDSLSLPNDATLFYVTSVEPELRALSTPEFFAAIQELDHELLAERAFGACRQPEWFEKLVLAWLFSAWYSGFPLHLFWLSNPGKSKTKFLEAMQAWAKEQSGLFDGSNSTWKALVPSFGTSIPQEGYIARVRRFGWIDEFFTPVMKLTQQTGLKNWDGMSELTALLDCSARDIASGKHEPFRVHPRGKLFFSTNAKPPHLMDMQDMVANLANNALTRILPYFMTAQHEEFIENRKAFVDSLTDEERLPKPSNMLALVDYLNAANVKLDWHKTEEIFERCKDVVPSTCYSLFEARGRHHINCIVDGVAKYNSVVEHRDSVRVEAWDYAQAQELMQNVLATWQGAH